MKIKEFTNVSPADLAKMSRDDLLRLARNGAALSNRRLSGLIKAGGAYSPAFQGLPASVRKQEKFTVKKSASKAQTIALIQSQQVYLRSKASTGGEWAKVSAKIEKEYGRTYARYRYTIDGKIIPESVAKRQNVPTLTRRQINKFWEIFHKMQQSQPAKFVSGNYNRELTFDTISDIFKENPNVSVDSALKTLEERANAEYEEQRKQDVETINRIRKGNGKTF